MKIACWLLCLSVMVLLLGESLAFRETLVCRQKAWLGSTEFLTREKITQKTSSERLFEPVCRLMIAGTSGKVFWSREMKSHEFNLRLEGDL